MGEVETWNGPFHKRVIPKGEYGTPGKIREELEEALDAVEQNQMLMLLIECSDILGAVVGALVQAEVFATDEEAYAHLDFECVPDSFSTITKAENLSSRLSELDSNLTMELGCEIVNVTLGLAALRGIEFSELQHFAVLRSEVARHAIKKVENNGNGTVQRAEGRATLGSAASAGGSCGRGNCGRCKCGSTQQLA